jgi:hypothetical protein
MQAERRSGYLSYHFTLVRRDPSGWLNPIQCAYRIGGRNEVRLCIGVDSWLADA